MVTKYKAAVFIIAAMFSSIASAAYTTMTIEGVKQANGVWTAAGVMDSSGFVRTTGAVSVMGTTRNLPVAMAVDTVAASAILKSTSRLLGPIALAASAYEVYEWVTASPNIDVSGNEWISEQMDTSFASLYVTYAISSWSGNACGFNCPARSLDAALSWLNSGDAYKPVVVKSMGKPVFNSNGTYTVPMTCTSKHVGQRCDITAVYATNPFASKDMQTHFNNLTDPSNSVLANGFNNIPSLQGYPIPITGVNFTPFSEWFSDPYYQDGNWYRDRMDVSPAPTKSSPTRVKVDIGPVKIQGATNPNVQPDTGTAGGNTPKEEPSFCEANPMSIACAEMGELKDEKLEVEERPVDVSYTPWGSSTSQCPADKVIPLWEGQSIAISYSPVCQFASLLRPLVIALAFVTAGFIVAGITRKGGGDA